MHLESWIFNAMPSPSGLVFAPVSSGLVSEIGGLLSFGRHDGYEDEVSEADRALNARGQDSMLDSMADISLRQYCDEHTIIDQVRAAGFGFRGHGLIFVPGL